MRKNWLIPRRTMLKGLTATIALPLLDSMGWAEDPKKGEYRSPIRCAFFMIPNGVNQDEWKPKTGMTTPYPRILMPLAPVMNEVMVINNLLHAKARANGDGAGDHARESSTFLTGTQCKKTSGADISTGISIDQKLAETIGVYTSLPSLELGMEGGGQAGNCDSGYSCAYSSNISWRTPTSPMAKETNPKAVFDRMFAARSAGRPKRGGGPAVDTSKFAAKGGDDGGAPSLEQSVLDEVLSDAKSLKGSVGTNDQRKLDEFLDSVRALEKRIEHAEVAAQEAAKQASEKKPGTYSAPITVTPPASPPTVYGERAKLMMDLITLAFQSDTTRIVTFSFGNGGSGHSYPELGVMGGHHEISHHGKDPVKLEGIAKINVHHVELFAYLLKSMKSLNDGKGTLLDHSMMVYGSAIGDGDRHNHDDLPILLAGTGGGTIKSGRTLNAKGNMCDLFLGMAARAGCQLPSFGDSSGLLEGLS
jgi:hypothetical protein